MTGGAGSGAFLDDLYRKKLHLRRYSEEESYINVGFGLIGKIIIPQ